MVAAPVPLSLEERVRRHIRAALARMQPEATHEKRRDTRYPYPHLVRITPVAADGRTVIGPSTVVVGKHLSERGLGFFHPQALPHRYVVAELNLGACSPLHLLLDLHWCRFAKEGWYDSGGQFLRAVDIDDLTDNAQVAAAG